MLFPVTSTYFAIQHQNKLLIEYYEYHFRALCVKIDMHDIYRIASIYSGSARQGMVID